jgi:hypothetical protein
MNFMVTATVGPLSAGLGGGAMAVWETAAAVQSSSVSAAMWTDFVIIRFL